MSDREVDELFSEEGGQPEPQTGLIVALLLSGVLLSLFGLACTAVPGALIVLLGWYHVDRDLDRLDNGYLPASAGARVRRLQQASWASLGIVLITFGLQAWFLAIGLYDALWGAAVQAVAERVAERGA